MLLFPRCADPHTPQCFATCGRLTPSRPHSADVKCQSLVHCIRTPVATGMNALTLTFLLDDFSFHSGHWFARRSERHERAQSCSATSASAGVRLDNGKSLYLGAASGRVGIDRTCRSCQPATSRLWCLVSARSSVAASTFLLTILVPTDPMQSFQLLFCPLQTRRTTRVRFSCFVQVNVASTRCLGSILMNPVRSSLILA